MRRNETSFFVSAFDCAPVSGHVHTLVSALVSGLMNALFDAFANALVSLQISC